MITTKAYESHTEKWWKGKKVITLRELSNGWFKIPAGITLEITGKYKGFDLKGLEICPHCKIGMKISISRIEPEALTLVVA